MAAPGPEPESRPVRQPFYTESRLRPIAKVGTTPDRNLALEVQPSLAPEALEEDSPFDIDLIGRL